MSENLPNQESEAGLYGEPKAELIPPGPRGQGVWEQLAGIFTEPSEVFRRLRTAPSWLGAFILTLVTALFATLVWVAKVDTEAAARRKFEVMEQAFHMTVPAEVVDKAMDEVATQSRLHMATTSSIGVLVMVPLGMLVLGTLLFAFAKFGGEDEDVTFRHGWAAVTVHGLAMVPIAVLAGVMCLIRNVGGAASYVSLAPSSPAFWIHPDNPWLRGLLGVFDPFYLFSFVALYLAARHTMRLKAWACITVMAITGLFGFLLHLFFGIF